jgi:hypothetical protein
MKPSNPSYAQAQASLALACRALAAFLGKVGYQKHRLRTADVF